MHTDTNHTNKCCVRKRERKKKRKRNNEIQPKNILDSSLLRVACMHIHNFFSRSTGGLLCLYIRGLYSILCFITHLSLSLVCSFVCRVHQSHNTWMSFVSFVFCFCCVCLSYSKSATINKEPTFNPIITFTANKYGKQNTQRLIPKVAN